ncbi:HD domain-containing protein [Mesonia sp. HuA40]|uniref:HD domain-containing protein n=1 Tax=Mesonia sp. HuA40 TaxID=2602761 RepID=UPI0011C71C23|nr:HD domain-containing protein [Mesonia sp. HuA40]TXK70598.1 HD domain-containing protein [Mesonia sp. HuA40]
MSAILQKAYNHCFRILKESRCNFLDFHNCQHTQEVYNIVKTIGTYEKLDKDELEIVLLAALFHDTGNTQTFQGHEMLSAHKASCFLNQNKYPKTGIEKLTNCILGTKMPQQPKTILEKVLCDADLAHLGSTDFQEKNKCLRLEWHNQLNLSFTTKEWLELNCSFLENHTYFTSFGKKFLEPQKQKNMIKIKNLLNQNNIQKIA